MECVCVWEYREGVEGQREGRQVGSTNNPGGTDNRKTIPTTLNLFTHDSHIKSIVYNVSFGGILDHWVWLSPKNKEYKGGDTDPSRPTEKTTWTLTDPSTDPTRPDLPGSAGVFVPGGDGPERYVE